jgi:hypothetical protein
VDPIALRFAAALMHSVPDARLEVSQLDGSTLTVSYETGAGFSPCDWRSLVTASCVHHNPTVARYAECVTGIRFEREFDPVGNTARRTQDGKLEFWFASTLDPSRLTELFNDYKSPIHPDTLDSGIIGDTELRVTLARVREVAPCSRQYLHHIATALAGQAAVAELIGDGVWATTS